MWQELHRTEPRKSLTKEVNLTLSPVIRLTTEGIPHIAMSPFSPKKDVKPL
jgi:hypothetical protein